MPLTRRRSSSLERELGNSDHIALPMPRVENEADSFRSYHTTTQLYHLTTHDGFEFEPLYLFTVGVYGTSFGLTCLERLNGQDSGLDAERNVKLEKNLGFLQR